MHDCDKDERIENLEKVIDKSMRRLEIIKIILTPKVLLSLVLAFCVLLQAISNLFK